MPQITTQSLLNRKQRGEKFACVTAYDAGFAALIARAGVETILIGDSLGMVVQGHRDTLPVTMDHMVYHIEAVSRGNADSLLIGDLPFMSYPDTGQTLHNAARLMRAGAHMVKLEGGGWLCDSINKLTQRGIPVCAHLGLTPQSVNVLGGFKVQGRSESAARLISDDAREVEAAGASMLVLECVPRTLAAAISRQLTIPVIGIGAGPDTDAQVLVLHDLLGITPNPPRFVKNFMAGQDSVENAIRAFSSAVKSGEFPAAEHSFNDS
jgi:3-methyl-2-oxobutanoate hydroxymethyltransferase